MPATKLGQGPGHYLCGFANWHPQWIQRYANTKMFMAVYGLLGTIQAMSYMYFIVTLTTIEKRFKIPSQTTGIILSGNEISQILLSLILSYIGGQRNRPRWIAWGIVFCGLSCFILALPHFIYGAGQDALELTKEYYDSRSGGNVTISLVNSTIKNSQQLCSGFKNARECESLISVVPLILIFLSQFVLGVGNTLYYSLGPTYLDDNTKKTNTPLMLAVAMSLRMIGPIMGFLVGYLSLNMFIDPTKTPLIDNKDPRWLGAWWFGWIILGSLMVLFSGLIGLFPKELPKKSKPLHNSHMQEDLETNEGLPLGRSFSSNATLDTPAAGTSGFPTFKDFPKALMRLLRNKLLIYNFISGIFYILGAAGYMTFLTKYMEVQFHKTAQTATIIVGPVSIFGMVIGLIGSGLIISKAKPSPSKVLMWNVIVGIVYILGQISYMFMYCKDTVSLDHFGGKLNLSATCNLDCACDNVPYSPVCHEATETTYFSPCYAGCQKWSADLKYYSNCSCLEVDVKAFNTEYDSRGDIIPKFTEPLLATTSLVPATHTVMPSLGRDDTTMYNIGTEDGLDSRARLSINEMANVLKPGICLKGCNIAFWTFSIASMIVNWFGSSGRIGNLLVNYRSVLTEDKSFAQGLFLMMVSLFALIPGPIIFGRIIDSTCLKWTKTCIGNGNCQIYDQTAFRYLVNITALSFTAIGVAFDILVWYHGRHLDLYGERETQRLEERERKIKPLTPLLAKK